MIYLGKLHMTPQRALVEVTQAAGLPVPPVLYHTKVKLKLYFSGAEVRILEAFVCGSTRYFWRLEHLRPLHRKEQRDSFRQRVTAKGLIQLIQDRDAGAVPPEKKPSDEKTPCQLVDLSLGGVQLRCKRRYEIGDLLELAGVTFPGQSPFSFIGRVCWLREEERGLVAYGCQFVQLDEREQDRLLRTIFKLQRESLSSRSGD